MGNALVDLDRQTSRQVPTIAETREYMAETGDVDGLWKTLMTLSWTDFDHDQLCRLLFRAIEVRATIDPAGFAADMHRRMASLVAFLQFRHEFRMHVLIRKTDQDQQRHGPPELPREITDVYMPHMMQLQTHLMEILECQARTARLWRLADQHRPDVRRATQQARAMQAQRYLAMESQDGRLPESVDREQPLHPPNGAKGSAGTEPAVATSAVHPDGPRSDCCITPPEKHVLTPTSSLNGALHGHT